MIKKYVLSICIAFALLFVGLYGFVFQNEILVRKESQGTVAFILQDENRVENYIDIKYKKYSNLNYKKTKEKVLDCKNYTQKNLKNKYNNSQDRLVDIPKTEGICWAAAMTSLLEYYGCDSSAPRISKKVLNMAVKEKYWYPQTNGIYDTELDDLLYDVFYSYGGKYKNYDTNNDTFDLYKTIKSEVNNGRVSLFSIYKHAMTSCGYVTYDVKYKYETWYGSKKDKTVTEGFVIVNDNDSDNKQYTYYPEDQILTGIIDRLNFTVTKIER